MAAAVVNDTNCSGLGVFMNSMMWNIVAPCSVGRRLHLFNESTVLLSYGMWRVKGEFWPIYEPVIWLGGHTLRSWWEGEGRGKRALRTHQVDV